MKCDEAQEFVSAMYDGETVPPSAAEHVAHCAACQEMLKAFAEVGAELRSFGSLQIAEPMPAHTWVQPRRTLTEWWDEGWQRMRIPRIAFGAMVLLLVLLGSRLAIVEVRAHEDGSVLLLKMTPPATGDSLACAVSTTNEKKGHCSGLAQLEGKNFFYGISAIRKDGDKVLLSVRSKVEAQQPASFGPDTERTLPESQVWFTPGESLAVPGTGALKLEMTGQWADHVPVAVGGNQLLDPAPNEIRLTSPLLLKNNKVVGDMAEASSGSDRADEGVFLYIPGEGRFFMSSTLMPGATRGQIKLNRISFESDGQAYVIVTGMPVSRKESLWVLHEANYRPESNFQNGAFLGSGPVSKSR